MFVNEPEGAVFISTPNEVLLRAAKDILAKTHQVFTRGSSNRLVDIKRNPYAFYDLIFSRKEFLLDLLDPNLKKLPTILNEKQGAYFLNMLNGFLQAYKNGVGNCGERAAVGLYLATSGDYDGLYLATLVRMKNVDHAFIKLQFKNGAIIFVDPWYRTDKYHGAIFDPASFDKYLSSLPPILRATQLAEDIAPFYPFRYLGVPILLGLYIYNPDRSQDFYLVASGAILCAVLFSVLLDIYTNINLTTELIERLTLINDQNPTMLNFDLFNDLCEHNLEKIGKGPVLFSKNARQLKEVDDKALNVLPVPANIKRERVGLFVS